jgi:hypothetical protein
MSENENNAVPESPKEENKHPEKLGPLAYRKFPGWMVALILILLIVIGVLGGYGSGMGARYAAQDTVVTGQNQDQFNLGMQAMDAGQYDIARLHFDSVIQNDPNFPGIQAAYADLLLRMLTSPTPTFTTTPHPTSTPDIRSAEEKFANVSQLLSAPADNLCARDWDAILSTLDSLRKVDPTYKVTEVDGMYFISLRNRGICKIYPQGFWPGNVACTTLNANLEGGIYDLTLAEHFVGSGNLDGFADSMRTYARLYIIGASYWEQDWAQAQYFFGQVMAAYPNISSYPCDPAFSASRRWHDATIALADEIMAKGDYCGADNLYATALAPNWPIDAESVAPTATAIRDLCVLGGGGEVTPAATP